MNTLRTTALENLGHKNAALIATLATAFLFATLLPDIAIAGPGGAIAKTLYSGFWGKLFLFLLIAVFLPLILLNVFKSQFAYRRAHRDLTFMARYDPRFNWMNITARARDCYTRVHQGWAKDDLSACADYMTEWYRDNQEATSLAKWRERGLVNVCDMKEILDVRPLLVSHLGHDNDHEGSMVVIEVKATMRDYLADRETGRTVEGSTDYRKITTLWTFVLDGGQWKVNQIDPADNFMSYVEQLKHVPKIETTVGTNVRA